MGRTAARIVAHPAATLAIGLVLFSGLGRGRNQLRASGFRRHHATAYALRNGLA